MDSKRLLKVPDEPTLRERLSNEGFAWLGSFEYIAGEERNAVGIFNYLLQFPLVLTEGCPYDNTLARAFKCFVPEDVGMQEIQAFLMGVFKFDSPPSTIASGKDPDHIVQIPSDIVERLSAVCQRYEQLDLVPKFEDKIGQRMTVSQIRQIFDVTREKIMRRLPMNSAMLLLMTEMFYLTDSKLACFTQTGE